MGVSPQGIEMRVRALAEEVTARAGYDLVDVEYRREPAGWTLRLFIDKSGGVNLSDCQRVSEEFGTILEVEDPIPNRFNLEVSSPGLDRPLKRGRDFHDALNRRVRITTREPLAGQKNFTGRLVWIEEAESAGGSPDENGSRLGTGVSDNPALRVLDDTGVEHLIASGAVERARVVHEWPEKSKGRGDRKAARAAEKERDQNHEH